MNFLPVLRDLAQAYQAFEDYSSRHVRAMGLTPVQFDVIATLGNQTPMTFKELGEKTLISKSSLTGVVERMSNKGMLSISENEDDARSQKIKLTAKGQKLFAKTFNAHSKHLSLAFENLSERQLKDIADSFKTFKSIFLHSRT